MDIQEIRNKYGVQQADEAGDALFNLKKTISFANKKLAAARTMRGNMQAKIKARNELVSLMNDLTSQRFAVKKEVDSATGAAYSLVNEIDKFVSSFKLGEREMATIQSIKEKYGVSQADAEGSDVARKRRQEETIRATEKNVSNAIKAYVELAQRFQKEHGDSKFVSAAKMRGWIR